MQREIQQAIIDQTLEMLAEEGAIYKLLSFYSLRNDPALADRRIKGNLLANKEMKHAAKAAAILAKFPYVKGLAISGSLSKNFADEYTDVDFFIVTAADRLWIARSFLQLLYKLAHLVGKGRWFCLNYYIDEKGLAISEKNIFTAMEIVTLVPMYGAKTMSHFINANGWVNNYFPLHKPAVDQLREVKPGFFRKGIERLLNTKLGDRLDVWLMKITKRRWQKKMKEQQVNEKGVRIGMLVDRHFSKPDPANFQHRILDQYFNKMSQLVQNKEKIIPLVN